MYMYSSYNLFRGSLYRAESPARGYVCCKNLQKMLPKKITCFTITKFHLDLLSYTIT